MQVITSHSVHLPQNVGAFICDNSSSHPCLPVQGRHLVIVCKLQISSPLVNRILQNNFTIISGEQEIFSCIQVISFFTVHIPDCITLGQRTCTIDSIIFPL